jgi:prephenate dehydrogenase
MVNQIGIIGGTGGIGRWFAHFLEEAGYSVICSGRSSTPSPEELAARAEVVIISVPMEVTVATIERLGPLVRKEALLLDLTSVKEAPLKAMLAASAAEVVGCHPLFGPTVPDLSGQNVVLCPGRGTGGYAWWKEVLARGGAVITEMDARQHDRIMAVVQGINHLNTILLGLVLEEYGLSQSNLAGLTTPLFEAKLSILDRLLKGNHPLYADLWLHNPGLGEVMDRYDEIWSELRNLVRQGRREELVALLARLKQSLQVADLPDFPLMPDRDHLPR